MKPSPDQPNPIEVGQQIFIDEIPVDGCVQYIFSLPNTMIPAARFLKTSDTPVQMEGNFFRFETVIVCSDDLFGGEVFQPGKPFHINQGASVRVEQVANLKGLNVRMKQIV